MKKNIHSFIAAAVGGLIVLTFAATSYDMQKGIDLTGQSSVSASMLNQLVDNSVVASNRGMIIYTNSAPTSSDVTANPRLARFIWLDSSQNPPGIYTWNGTNWVANGLASDSVLTTHILNGNVTSAKLATNAVQNYHLDNNVVTANEIASDAVNSSHLGSSVVDSTNIIDGTVALADMAASSVGAFQIVTASINSNHIGAAQIALTNLADNIISTAKIQADAVATASITNDAVTLAKLDHTGGSSNQVLKATGSAIVWATPVFTESITIVDGSNFPTASGERTYAHGLSGVPKIVRVVARCDTAEHGYAEDDEVSIDTLIHSTAQLYDSYNLIVYADATNVYVRNASGQVPAFLDSGGGVQVMTEANWTLKFYVIY